jgi:hypothetical protein
LQIRGGGVGEGIGEEEEEVMQRGDATAKEAMVRKMRDFIVER